MFRRLYGALARRFLGPVRIFRARRALPQLALHDDARIRAVGQALEQALSSRLVPAERRLVRPIEARRAELAQSDARISVIDYGAGDGTTVPTHAEAARGVPYVETVRDVCRASKSPFWAIFLLALVRRLGPASCVELGSCVGISAAYQAAALRLGGGGTLKTLEGSPEVAAIARETLSAFPEVEVVVGPFHETLAGVLAAAAPVDFFFNDGHHDHDAVLHYFEQALPHLAPSAVVVLDDISWSPGMRRAWTHIQAHERVSGSVDLGAIGVVLLGGGPRNEIQIPLP